jgi:SAM-dependent methyltransferase
MSEVPKDMSACGQREAGPTAKGPGDAPGDVPDAKRRFSGRVENYVKYRPGYPPAVLDNLRESVGLTPQWVVADVGSGTGISSELFLKHGNEVYGVEPNAEMRRAAERLLAGYPRFHSIDGSAEHTTLADQSVDLVAAGQAFHWFDPAAARREFGRILRPGRPVVLMWNTRHVGGTPFLETYERLLLEYGTDYQKVRHEGVTDERLREFFGRPPQASSFPNRQQFDYAGIEGRLLSSSYAPAPGRPGHTDMLRELRRIFDAFNSDGRVTILYDTQVYVGAMA